MNELLIGRRVKEMRLKLDLTLAELGRRAGLSKSLLSKVENAQVSPPIATLYKIARALDVPMGYFFEEEAREDRVIYVPKDKRQRVEQSRHAEYGYEHLASGSTMMRLMEPFMITLEANSQAEPTLFESQNEEFILVLEGEVDYLFGSTSYHLTEGDALYFDARVPHGPKQVEGKAVRYLAVFTNR